MYRTIILFCVYRNLLFCMYHKLLFLYVSQRTIFVCITSCYFLYVSQPTIFCTYHKLHYFVRSEVKREGSSSGCPRQDAWSSHHFHIYLLTLLVEAKTAVKVTFARFYVQTLHVYQHGKYGFRLCGHNQCRTQMRSTSFERTYFQLRRVLKKYYVNRI